MAITIVVTGTVQDAEGARTVGRKICEDVEAGEPGTLVYEWYLSPDAARFMSHEVSADSDAFAAHVARQADNGNLGRFMEVAEISSVVAGGDMDDQARDILLNQFGASLFTPLAGVNR